MLNRMVVANMASSRLPTGLSGQRGGRSTVAIGKAAAVRNRRSRALGSWEAQLRAYIAAVEVRARDEPSGTAAPPRRARSWRADLFVVALAGAACLAFAGIAEEVGENETLAIDRALLLSLREKGDPADPIGPGWVEEVGRDLTALGSVSVVALFTAAAGGYLWLARKRRAALLLVGAIASGELLGSALKAVFERPRPDLVAHRALVYTSSFPSGHSMMAAVAFITAGALLARAEPRRRVKVFIMTCAIALTALTGASRVYLGVHWPTDVAAGWLAGAGWAAICWSIASFLERWGVRWNDRRALAPRARGVAPGATAGGGD
jgi:undecaprenyl-diphosphatase